MNLNREIGKKAKLPSKKATMNLYQAELKDDPKKVLLAAIVILGLLVVVMSKFFILDGILEIRHLKKDIAAEEVLIAQMQTTIQGYGELKEKYYRYSENFSSDEERLVDRVEMLDLLEDVTSDLVKADSIAINGNHVQLNVSTSNLDNISKLRKRFEEKEMVKNVIVYSANKGNGSLSASVSFDCVVMEEE